MARAFTANGHGLKLDAGVSSAAGSGRRRPALHNLRYRNRTPHLQRMAGPFTASRAAAGLRLQRPHSLLMWTRSR